MGKVFLLILVRHLFIEFGRAHLRDSGVSSVHGSCKEEDWRERGNLRRPFLMVYYEETKLISNWQLNTVLALSSAEAPSVVKRRENGQPTGRMTESSAEERALLVQI